MNCSYCEDPAIRERGVVENDLAFSFLSYMPIVPGHTLVSPKRHLASYEELTSEERDAIEDLRMKVRKALQSTFRAEGFNYAWNEGEVAGQSVPHLHLHVLPRVAGDTGIHEYEPRKFLYRSGSRAESPQEELIAVAEQIRKSL